MSTMLKGGETAGPKMGPPLLIQPKSASDLVKKSRLGVAEPYVVAKLTQVDPMVVSKPSMCGTRARTRHAVGLNPTWDDVLQLNWKVEGHIDEHNGPHYFLLLQIFDRHRLGRDSFLGQAVLNLRLLPPSARSFSDTPAVLNIPLRPRTRKQRVSGHLRVAVGYDLGAVGGGAGKRTTAATKRGQPESFSASPAATAHAQPLDLGFAKMVGHAEPSSATTHARDGRDDRNGSGTATGGTGAVSSAEAARAAAEDAVELDEPSTDDAIEQRPLPEGWGTKTDRQGRLLYVNHKLRRVTYRHPLDIRRSSRRTSSGSARIYCAQVSPHPRGDTGDASDTCEDDVFVQVEEVPIATTTTTTTTSNDDEHTRAHDASHGSSAGRGVNDVSSADGRGGHDTSDEQGGRHANDDGAAVESSTFSVEDALPPGWVKSKTATGRVFFIDHNTKRTTWDDPRTHYRRMGVGENAVNLPRVRRLQPADSLSDLGMLPAKWEERQTERGRRYFVNHRTRTTQWEDPRTGLPPSTADAGVSAIFSQAFVDKKRHLHSLIKRTRPRGKCDISVSRSRIFEQSYSAVLGMSPDQLRRELRITFEEERGLDFGGPTREWFYLLSHEMFNPYYGLFEYSAADSYTLQMSPTSSVNPDHLRYFQFIGRVVGMAIYHGRLLDVFFIHPFYKMMLRRHIALADVEVVDADYYRSLQWILDNDPTQLELTFEVDREEFGTVTHIELKPGGADIPVTQDNKEEYVNLVVKHKFVDQVAAQMDAFMEGLTAIVPLDWLEPFTSHELELLISGISEIDIHDWRAHTVYLDGYTNRSQVIGWFWQAISSLNMQERARVLQFVTGTSRVPMNGFAELYGSNGLQRFCIARRGGRSQLPRAHTCFNRLDLPQYQSYDELREKLLLAVENTEGYDGVD
ncbi:ubiquitin-protein ligase [Salpingoeca rosetta]|uniref:E3 ubiquitin-protein ligase n=1 Tax=Salpingoeca rosetta (strain ATCC 50818 / BSB-021) TaxID=946362 RepID=F2U154_SALR5|nr:ubiquitin-protein ligase [Salpingoeca rosetta]EGD80628.1 ubiquitin-protein ligase [Salpingoeca rosetta]|eukprot:XP_004997189.1 ubiquitin-protein ligase [Salpingoeca rosetta]